MLEAQEIVVDFAEETERAQVSILMQSQQGVAAISSLLERKGYLTCEECGNDIPAERRAAYPAARTCVPCQTIIEKFYG